MVTWVTDLICRLTAVTQFTRCISWQIRPNVGARSTDLYIGTAHAPLPNGFLMKSPEPDNRPSWYSVTPLICHISYTCFSHLNQKFWHVFNNVNRVTCWDSALIELFWSVNSDSLWRRPILSGTIAMRLCPKFNRSNFVKKRRMPGNVSSCWPCQSRRMVM